MKDVRGEASLDLRDIEQGTGKSVDIIIHCGSRDRHVRYGEETKCVLNV